MQVSKDFQNDMERIMSKQFGHYVVARTETAYSAYPQLSLYLKTPVLIHYIFHAFTL